MALATDYETVGEVLAQTPDLSTFNQLVRRSGLIVELDNSGPFTVFAPTNEAFERLPRNALGNIVKNREYLNRFVRHHVVSGLFEKDQLRSRQVMPTILGVGLTVIETDPGPYVGGAMVVDANIGAGNGAVHTLDAVMMPEHP